MLTEKTLRRLEKMMNGSKLRAEKYVWNEVDFFSSENERIERENLLNNTMNNILDIFDIENKRNIETHIYHFFNKDLFFSESQELEKDVTFSNLKLPLDTQYAFYFQDKKCQEPVKYWYYSPHFFEMRQGDHYYIHDAFDSIFYARWDYHFLDVNGIDIKTTHSKVQLTVEEFCEFAPNSSTSVNIHFNGDYFSTYSLLMGQFL